jgi:prevent-host-death family protein
MSTANPSEMRRDLHEILNRVQYKRERVTVLRFGKPAALLVPYDEIVTDPAQAWGTTVIPLNSSKNSEKITEKTPKPPKIPPKSR